MLGHGSLRVTEPCGKLSPSLLFVRGVGTAFAPGLEGLGGGLRWPAALPFPLDAFAHALRKAGALLEDIAPGHPGPAGDTATSRRNYEDILERAKLAPRTAIDWRAAGKLGTETYSKYLAI